MQVITSPARPQARQWSAQPGRLNTSERLRSAVTARRLSALEDDWLFQSVSSQGRVRLMVEHGLLPRSALGPR